jgi:choline kinase
MDEAVILAGGLGRRLRRLTGDIPKYIYRIDGYPLIVYPIKALYLSGVKRFVMVVSNIYSEKILSTVYEYLGDIDIVPVINQYPEAENGYSFYLGFKMIEADSFILSMSDHIYPPSLISRMLEVFDECGADILICGDSDPKYVFVNEATKILIDSSGKIINMGKNLDNFTYIDAGVFIMRRESIEDLLNRVNIDKGTRLCEIILSGAEYGLDIKVCDVESGYWVDVDSEDDVHMLLNGRWKLVLDRAKAEWDQYE